MIALISDIHGNLEALDSVLSKIDDLKIRQIYCLGDIVGYGTNPAECIDVVRKRKIRCLMGNHEWAVLNKNTDSFNPLAAVSIWYTIDHLETEDLDYLRKLEERIILRIKDQRILLVHGSPFNPLWDYVYEDSITPGFLKDYGAVVMGHTHTPFVKYVGSKFAANCGAVGQPRDQNRMASFAVLDDVKFTAEIMRVEYDISSAAGKITDAGLPGFLAQRLFLGI